MSIEASFWLFGIHHEVLTQNTGESIFTSKPPEAENRREQNMIRRHDTKKKIMKPLNL
jgi:hypothetical protein